VRDFYASSEPVPLDQADGLRRLFAGARARRFIPLVANPHAPFSGVAIERLTAALAAEGRHTLVVDAADDAPAPPDVAHVDLAGAIEALGHDVSYLPARNLPLAYVDTRGSASALLDAVADAAPHADVVLMHATASDLARLFQRRAVRPVLIGADQPESIKHAYAAVKLLAQRCGLMTFDLLLTAAPRSPRLPQIAASLGSCADGFLGSVLQRWAAVDPAGALDEAPRSDLSLLVQAQLRLDSAASAPPAAHAAVPHRPAHA
jgi:hypothetical protein